MLRKAVLFISIALLVALTTAALAGAQQVPSIDARARLIDVSDKADITGILRFRQYSDRLEVRGKAEGFTPGKQYVSLVYGINSDGPRGDDPCGRDGTLTFEQMALAQWLPITGEERTLMATKFTVTLQQIRTASIREVKSDTIVPDPFQDLPPQAFLLRSCGVIKDGLRR